MSAIRLFFCIGMTMVFFTTKVLYAQNDSIASNKLYVELYNLNFVKNNEYFNHIADGYTLIGSQLHPRLAFYPHPKAKLVLGVFGLTYAGLNSYHKLIPAFSFVYATKRSQFIMGTLRNSNSHGLIAPLMAPESQLDERRIENGLQYLLDIDKLQLDVWLNWEKFIFKKATHNEEFVVGISAKYRLFQNEKWKIILPLQNLLYHRGGQINTNKINDREVFTMRHTALGLYITHQLTAVQNLLIRSYFIRYQSSSIPLQYPFDKGCGGLTEFRYRYKNWTLGLGYWYAHRFVSPHGDAMFQSVSTKTDTHYENGVLQEIYKHHAEPERRLLLGMLSYKKEILPNIHLGGELNTYYQNDTSNPTPEDPLNKVAKQWDYSIQLRISYSGDFKLLKW